MKSSVQDKYFEIPKRYLSMLGDKQPEVPIETRPDMVGHIPWSVTPEDTNPYAVDPNWDYLNESQDARWHGLPADIVPFLAQKSEVRGTCSLPSERND